MAERLLRLDAVEEKVGWRKSKIYQEIKRGRFPAPVKHGAVNTWPESEIDAYVASLIAGRGAVADA